MHWVHGQLINPGWPRNPLQNSKSCHTQIPLYLFYQFSVGEVFGSLWGSLPLRGCTGTPVRAWTVSQGAEGSLILPSLHCAVGSATQLRAIFKHSNKQAPPLKDSDMPYVFLGFESQADKLKAKKSLIQINFISCH